MSAVERVEPGPGQESVWDYPRPPAIEKCYRRIRVEFGGRVIADTRRAYKYMETSHPPVYYIPFQDFAKGVLEPTEKRTVCEYKGWAGYFDVHSGGSLAKDAAWTYAEPKAGFEGIADHVAVYPQHMDACYVDNKEVTPQPGAFYGGWVTSDVVGPFKGGPDTLDW